MLYGLLDAQPWPKLAWADLIEELLVLGRTDIPLVRLAEGHIDALRILDQADRTPEPNALYGVWASRSQQTGVQAQRTDSGGLVLTGTLSFASGAGLLDRALVPVWLVDGTHLLVDLAAATSRLTPPSGGPRPWRPAGPTRCCWTAFASIPRARWAGRTSIWPDPDFYPAGSGWRPVGWVAPQGSSTCCTGGTRSRARGSSSGWDASGPP